MTNPVSHYGLHTSDEGVMFLHQGRGHNNFIGLKASSPFSVVPRKNQPCPHLINSSASVPDVVQWDNFSKVLLDPLVQAMLPVPKAHGEPIPYLPDPQNELQLVLVALSRMSSPIYPVVVPFGKLTQGQLRNELSITNACPLVLTGVECEDNAFLNEIASEAVFLPRRLIVTGNSMVVVRSPLKRIQTNLWSTDSTVLMSLPMESLGALLLRRYARGERLDTPIVRN